MKKSFVAIGHIVNDTLPRPHLGGSVAYTAIAAKRLGYQSHIITKCPPNHPYIKELKSFGVDVHILDSKLTTITSFENKYSATGKRKQQVLEKQEPITQNDLKNVPKDLFDDAIVLIAPVVAEVDMNVFSQFKTSRLLSVTAQGYFREIDTNGVVTQKEWKDFAPFIPKSAIAILSTEDITIDGKLDNPLLERLKSAFSIVVLTEGENGAIVYEQGRKPIQSNAVHLQNDELVDFTGAGDVFAAAFLTEYDKTNSIEATAQFANEFAAEKIKGVSGIGVDSIPSRES